jgi:SAM-dependent methyltransferase
MKDNFSGQSEGYSKYRPLYPLELFDFINAVVKTKILAWDCATGNGQSARELAKTFKTVYASDVSEKQLAQAPKLENVIYAKEPAEQTSLTTGTVNLVTVAQALHWFDLDKFYAEVRRVSAPGGMIAVWTYSLFSVSPEIDQVMDEYHFDTLQAYWDPERQYVDEGYENIPFPFPEIDCPRFEISVDWDINSLEGYLDTWSAVQKYIKVNGTSPVPGVIDRLKAFFPVGKKLTIRFPLYLKMGHVL